MKVKLSSTARCMKSENKNAMFLYRFADEKKNLACLISSRMWFLFLRKH